MFDFGWSHLIILMVVALVVVGPKDLPKLMRTAGQWAGRARSMADQFRRSFEDMARQSELDELRAEVNRLKTETTSAADIGYSSLGIPDKPISESPLDMSRAPPEAFSTPPAPKPEAVPAAAPLLRKRPRRTPPSRLKHG